MGRPPRHPRPPRRPGDHRAAARRWAALMIETARSASRTLRAERATSSTREGPPESTDWVRSRCAQTLGSRCRYRGTHRTTIEPSPNRGAQTILRGVTTVVYQAADLDAAVEWYSKALETEPYFVRKPRYVEFRIGDFQHELGILAAETGAAPSGVIAYWAVDDVEAAYQRLLA